MEIETGRYEMFSSKEAFTTETNIPAFLQNCINNIVKKEAYKTHKVNINKIPTDGGNYLAVLYEIDIKGTTESNEKEVNIFVKNIIDVNDNLSGFFSVKDAYALECFVYKELSNIFTKLQDEANVPIEDRYKMVKGYAESSEEAIILENVAKKGFKTCDRMKLATIEFAELSIQQLAKFHALGFVIKKKMSEYYENNLKTRPYMIEFNEQWKSFAIDTANATVQNLSSDFRKKAEAFIPMYVKKLPEYFSATDSKTISTLCHGDFRANNILAKEVNGVIMEVIPIDYQIVYHGCPIMDFLYLIYGCTDRKFRQRYLKHLSNMYYETMRTFLQHFDIEVNDVYPRKEFEALLKDRQDYGLMVAISLYIFFFAPEDNIPNLTETLADLKIKLDPKIIRRIEEIIEDLDDFE